MNTKERTELYREIFLKLIPEDLVARHLNGARTSTYIRLAACLANEAVDVYENDMPVKKWQERDRIAQEKHDKCVLAQDSEMLKKMRVVDQCLPVRDINVLFSNNILTLYDLVQLSRNDLMKLKNIGRKTIYHVEDMLADLGLQLSSTPKF